MAFHNRAEAAAQLARRLDSYRGRHPLILAIPRGAVAMGRALADALDGELDVVLVRKLRSPFNPELAIGAVDESGWAFVADYARRLPGVSEGYIEEEKKIQLQAMANRRARYTPVRPPIDPAGRIAIVVDDGLATGATMISALHAVRARQPEKLICAVPVAPPDTVEKVAAQCDEVVCLETPFFFQAVSQFYREFPQVEDEEVMELLAGR